MEHLKLIRYPRFKTTSRTTSNQPWWLILRLKRSTKISKNRPRGSFHRVNTETTIFYRKKLITNPSWQLRRREGRSIISQLKTRWRRMWTLWSCLRRTILSWREARSYTRRIINLATKLGVAIQELLLVMLALICHSRKIRLQSRRIWFTPESCRGTISPWDRPGPKLKCQHRTRWWWAPPCQTKISIASWTGWHLVAVTKTNLVAPIRKWNKTSLARPFQLSKILNKPRSTQL